MKSEFLVFGGSSYSNAHQRPAWDRYEVALAIRIRDGAVVDRLEYRGWKLDEEVGLSRLFRAASIVDGIAFTCTSTEVVEIDLASFRIARTHTHRLFNDLHHVVKIGDSFFVASTGTDSILEFDAEWQLVKRYPITDDELLRRHGADSDFRRIPTTKPHNAHPNFVASWNGEIWATNFEAGRVQSIQSALQYHVSEHRIHDGIPRRGLVWFTSVNGTIVRMNSLDGTIETFDLAGMTTTDRQLGWCRGLEIMNEDEVVVGFSKLRETKLRENLKWLGNKLLGQDYARSEPTRIAGYDLERRKELWRVDLEQVGGLDAIFSIHAL